MDAMSLKPVVTLEVGSFSGLSLGGDPLSGNPFFDDPTSAASAAFAIFNNPHQCPHCLHRTKTKPELLRHVSYYHSDFRFTCALCHYKCRTNGLLKKHMLKHTEEKPYSCNVCSYKTARKQHLVRHTKLHTGEKPFSCPICAYKASRKDRLREHLRKHRELNNLKFDFSEGQIEIERAEEHRS